MSKSPCQGCRFDDLDKGCTCPPSDLGWLCDLVPDAELYAVLLADVNDGVYVTTLHGVE